MLHFLNTQVHFHWYITPNTTYVLFLSCIYKYRYRQSSIHYSNYQYSSTGNISIIATNSIACSNKKQTYMYMYIVAERRARLPSFHPVNVWSFTSNCTPQACRNKLDGAAGRDEECYPTIYTRRTQRAQGTRWEISASIVVYSWENVTHCRRVSAYPCERCIPSYSYKACNQRASAIQLSIQLL